MSLRTIAVDWSGAKEPLKSLWLAEAEPGRLIDLRPFSTREALVAHVVEEKEKDPHLVVGLDFAFSFPAWLLRAEGIDTAPALWARVRAEADRWLGPKWPFWGKGGAKRPSDIEEFRRTDLDLKEAGRRPKLSLQAGWRRSSRYKLAPRDAMARSAAGGRVQHLAIFDGHAPCHRDLSRRACARDWKGNAGKGGGSSEIGLPYLERVESPRRVLPRRV